VSLHWRRHLRIFLAPQQVSLMDVSGVVRRQVPRKQAVPVEHAPAVPQWQPAIAALASVLDAGDWRAGSADVVVSGHFARYTLVPWSDQLTGRQERRAFLRHCFHLAYGDASRQWDLCMSRPVPDAASLASGTSLELLEALKAALGNAGVRLEGVYPALMAGANQSRHALRQGLSWLCVKEPGRVDLALLEDGNWQSVSSHEADAEAAGTFAVLLETLMARESALLGKQDQGWPVVLYWPGKVFAPGVFPRKVIPARLPVMKGVGPDEGAFFQLLAGV
jgi:hypothetical protein